MSFAPHEVYSRSLLGTHGYPLWTPQLKTQLRESYQLEGLKIGDVGIVSSNDGSFDVLFNITLERNEQPYPELVRENFTPILLDQQRDLATQPDAVAAHGVISSDSVELMSQEVHGSCDQEPPRAEYEFSLSMEEGAVLILPEGAQSFDLASEKTFLGEAIRHGIDWYECATEEAGRLISNDSLYLITGFHKARSWSVGAAERVHSNIKKPRSVKFKVGQIDQGRATARAYQWTATRRFTGRIGPTYPYEIADCIRDERLRRGVNQTVFVRGFRITVNKILFLKTVSVKTRQGTFFGFGTYIDKLWGRPSESTPSSDAGPTDNAVDQDSSMDHSRLYMDPRMTIDRLPDVSKAFHPGDSINRYMLKKEPRAIVALTHDNIWIEMLRTGLLELADFSCEKRLEEVLSKNCRIIVEDSAVYLQREGHVFESSPRRHSEWTLPSSALTGSIQTPGLYPECTGQEQAKDETLPPRDRPQHVPSFSSSATRANKEGETTIICIRATDVALGLEQVPAGFYTVVRHSGLEWRTDNKRSSVNDDIEWRGPIPIPSDLSAIVCIEVFASFGFQPVLGAGERVRKLAATVQQLLDRSEKYVPFTFFPNDGNSVSRRSSILVTVKRQRGESGSSTLGVPGSVQRSLKFPTDVISVQLPEAVIHSDITQTIPESAPLPHSKISPNTSSVSRNLESGHRKVTTPPSSTVSSSELLISPPSTVELSLEDEPPRMQIVSSTNSSEFVMGDPPVREGSLPSPSSSLQLRPTPLTQSLRIQDGRNISPSTSPGTMTYTITTSVASAPLTPPLRAPVIQPVFGVSNATSNRRKCVSADVKDDKEDDHGEGDHGEVGYWRSTTATARAGVTHLAHGRQHRPKKGKEVRQRPKRSHSVEHVAPLMPRKPSAQQQYPAQPERAEKKGTVFVISSGSSNGSRSTSGSTRKSHAESSVNELDAIQPSTSSASPPQPPVIPKGFSGRVTASGITLNANAQSRKTIVVANISSEEYETTNNEDSEEWASEEMNAGGVARKAEETRLREAALEAQRQRELFAKVPKRSYSNLNRTHSGLLSQLMNPDSSIFPPNHPYRISRSSGDISHQYQHPQHHAPVPQRSSSAYVPPRLSTSKSAALPMAAQTIAISSSKPPSSSVMKWQESEKGVSRRKEPPKGVEVEDGDSDDKDDRIQMSQSVAQQKLQALMSRRSLDRGTSHLIQPVAMEVGPGMLSSTTAPIPFGHPYNLPAAPAPMTPRTTRRQMLRTELSESMRRQLLWERQVSSNNNATFPVRRATPRMDGLQPLTSNSSDGIKDTTRTTEPQDKDERRRRAMPGIRSWADDYHYSG